MSTKHLSLDRTLFFHHIFGEAILKRHLAMRRQNCFQNRLFLYFWATFPWTFGGLSVVLLVWCSLGAIVFCHFLVSSLWVGVVFCVEIIWVLSFWLGVVWGRPFFVISLISFLSFFAVSWWTILRFLDLRQAVPKGYCGDVIVHDFGVRNLQTRKFQHKSIF